MAQQEPTHRPITWSTLAEYEGDPDVLARSGAAEWNTKPKGYADTVEEMGESEWKMRRRTFMKMSGFAAVLAAVAGCEKPVEKIIPYVVHNEELTVGVSNYYATTAGAVGFIATTREGRPIKLEGNPSHPLTSGKLTARMQASLIELYDPDRIPHAVRVGAAADGEDQKVSWEEAWQDVAGALREAGSRAALVTGPMHGPARMRLMEAVKQTFPGLRHVVYEPLAEPERLEARELSYGDRAMPRFHWQKSMVTVLLGADPMSDAVLELEAQRGIGLSRKVRAGDDGKATMGRLYSFEPLMTMSGMNADYRPRVKTAHLLPIAKAIAAYLASTYSSDFPGVRVDAEPAAVEREANLPEGMIAQVAEDLYANRGRSIVYTGGAISRTADSVRLHAAVNLLNSMLGNEGETIDTSRPLNVGSGSAQEMLALVEDMRAGNVDVLLVADTNPAYALPPSAGFMDAARNVGMKVSFDTIKNETSAGFDYILPAKHWLESWSDSEAMEGLLGVQQPVIGEVNGWDNRSFEESMMGIARAGGSRTFDIIPPEPPEGGEVPQPVPMGWHDFIIRVWEEDVYKPGGYAGTFEDFWFSTLRRGVLDAAFRIDTSRSMPRLNLSRVLDAISGPSRVDGTGLELVTFTMTNTFDGRHANNPWLLELPDPVSKVCWDNYVAMAPSTAAANDLQDGDIVRLTTDGGEILAPVRVHPGCHPEVLAVGTGWGRTEAGAVGTGEGFNAFTLATVADNRVLHSGFPVQWEKTGEKTRLADVQGHNYMKLRPEGTPGEEGEAERQIVQQTSLELFNKDPMNPQPYYHIPYWHTGKPIPDIWNTDDFPYTQHKWVMSIDLNSCTGCNACMIACQAENNIPVVGKREVLMGREMHWIRIDRYYKGDPENPEVAKQPMLCQHCTNAPCETVCPVLATVHSDDGINQQVYNRCVGTRYCANNCPYKVRRFNFYQYSDFRKGPHDTEHRVPETPLALALNPDITVRTKGIMEKCTFCQQRVRQAKYDAKARGRDIPDGSLQTACQQTCPSEAIVFGDSLNPEHEVNRIREANVDRRGYGVLAEFNVQPAVMYLADVKNRETRPYDVENAKKIHHQAHALQDHGDGHGEGGSQDKPHDSGYGGEQHSALPRTGEGAPS